MSSSGDESAPSCAGQDANRNPTEGCNNEGQDSGQRTELRPLTDQGRDPSPRVRRRLSEIEADHSHHPVDILAPERLVQAERMALSRNGGL